MRRLLNHLGALAVMIAGAGGVLWLLVWMNAWNEPPQKEKARESVAVQVAPKAPKKKPRPRRRSRPKKAPTRSTRPRTPPPQLGSAMSGIALGGPMGLDTGHLGRGGSELLGDTGKNLVMTQDTVDEPPRAARRVPAAYPRAAQRRGVTGYVKLSLTITQSGEVADARVVESEPAGVFDEAALGTIRRWSFTPGRYKGAPQTVTGVIQVIRFDLTRRSG